MLHYLFRADFEGDNLFYFQQPDDKARLADHGSAFTDVMFMQEQGDRLVSFALCEPENGDPVAAVHLTDGHFEINGNEFFAGVDGLGEGVERRLIYFRQVTQTRTTDFDTTTGEQVGAWQEHTTTRYVIGWQATIDGRNVQHMIALDG